jgi:hypothetical protein
MANVLHHLFGAHRPDPDLNHWDRGRFASSCLRCGRAMEKLPGLDWELKKTRAT